MSRGDVLKGLDLNVMFKCQVERLAARQVEDNTGCGAREGWAPGKVLCDGEDIRSPCPVKHPSEKEATWSGARVVKGQVEHKVKSSRCGCKSSNARAMDRRRIAVAAVVVK